MRAKPDRSKQLCLFRRGGVRAGAGRTPRGDRALVPHDARPRVTRHDPVFVTTRVLAGLPSLRTESALAVLRPTLVAGADRFGFRLVQYSIQSNHLHLLVEARDRIALARGMQGVLVRVARALNRAWQRAGRVVSDRFHARALRTPREVRHALVYVLANARKHGAQFRGVDACSPGRWFDGWIDRACTPASPLPRAASWLLSVGWRKHGAIATDEHPLVMPREPSRARARPFAAVVARAR